MKQTTGTTQAKTAENMEEAISINLEGLKIEGEPLSEASSMFDYMSDVIA